VENVASVGTFLGGLGLFLLSFGLFWWVSLYDKHSRSKQE
jgi:hypothetical protein